jgi:uncharacterized protein
MKYFLVILLVFVVFWLWSNNRRIEKKQADDARRPQQPAQKNELTEIVACDVCQVHLPRSEALIGSKGVYCSDAHRRQADR